MKVAVDRDLCQGHGVCESEAPGVFHVGKDSRLEILLPSPPDDRGDEVLAAVRFCPTSALTIEED